MHADIQTRRRPFALVGIAVAALAGGLLFGAAPAVAETVDEPTATMTATPDAVAVGEEFTLTWTSSGYVSVTHGDSTGPGNGGPFDANGSITHFEDAPGGYVYVLWGYAPGADETAVQAASVTVHVTPADDDVELSATLTATPNTVAVDEEFTITWTSTGYVAVRAGVGDVIPQGNLPTLSGTAAVSRVAPGDYEYVLWGLSPGAEAFMPVAQVTVHVVDPDDNDDFGDLVTAESQECHAFTFTNVTSDFGIVVRYRADGQDTMEFVNVPYGESATIEYDADEVFYSATLEGIGESGPSTEGSVVSAECETVPPVEPEETDDEGTVPPVSDPVDTAETLPVTGPAGAGLWALIAAFLLAGGVALTRVRRA